MNSYTTILSIKETPMPAFSAQDRQHFIVQHTLTAALQKCNPAIINGTVRYDLAKVMDRLTSSVSRAQRGYRQAHGALLHAAVSHEGCLFVDSAAVVAHVLPYTDPDVL